MKRLVSVLVLLAALVGAVAVATAAQSPSGGVPAQAAAGVTVRQGNFGKITAIKPPGDWQQSGGPADFRDLFRPLISLVLPVFGVDTNLGVGNETVIVSNPANPFNFLAGANSISRFTTTDGGLTWDMGFLDGGGDPAAAFDSAGRAYFAELGNTSSCPDNPLLYKSTDGGLTFGAAVQPITDPQPLQHFFDKEWVTVDNNATSPFLGRIYYTVTNFNTGVGCNLSQYIDDREQLVFSTDQGATWSPPTNINDASHNQDQLTNPVAARDGTLYVGYQFQNCTFDCTSSIPMANLVAKSTDGGVSFSPSITITGQPITPTGAFSGGSQILLAVSTATGFRHNDQAIIGVSPSNANQVYALWTDGRWDTTFEYMGIPGRHADIAFSRSTDAGATWTPAMRVNDDAEGNGKDQFFPWMTVGSDGTIHASWMDRRDSATGFQYREYYSRSTDGGLTWSANQAVADAGGTPSSFIGDYSGLAVNSDNTLVLPIWTDRRSGTQVFTDRGVLTSGGTPSPTPTPAPILVGHVTWQGPPAQPSAGQQLPVSLTLQLGSTLVNYPSQNTDASGFFTASVTGLAAGTYNWRAIGPKYLANCGTVTLSGSGRTNQEMGLMKVGDANGDNVVGAADFTILKATFGLGSGDPGYDPRADFSGDGIVNAVDFTLLRVNFGLGGCPALVPAAQRAGASTLTATKATASSCTTWESSSAKT